MHEEKDKECATSNKKSRIFTLTEEEEDATSVWEEVKKINKQRLSY